MSLKEITIEAEGLKVNAILNDSESSKKIWDLPPSKET